MTIKRERIRFRIIAPFSLIVIAVSLIAAFGSYRSQQYNLHERLDTKLTEVVNLFDYLLKVEARFLHSQLKYIAQDEKIINAWRERDRDGLYRLARPFFEEMRHDFGITHFYFIDPDKFCYLRVHMQERYGDLITRHTLRQAADHAEFHSGIELGPLGTFTLRAVYPLIKNNNLIGYLELGEEIEHLTPRLKEISNLELLFTIDKVNLKREQWENGVKFLGKEDNWEDFKDFVVIDKTTPSLPGVLRKEIEDVCAGRAAAEDIANDQRRLRLAARPLLDADLKNVGRLVALYDITENIGAQKKIVQVTGGIVFAVLGMLFVFFYVYTGRIERQHIAYEDDLEGLVEERTAELKRALAEVEVLSGFLPICSYCKKIRDDQGYWSQIETYISRHSRAQFSHGICDECFKKHRPDRLL